MAQLSFSTDNKNVHAILFPAFDENLVGVSPIEAPIPFVTHGFSAAVNQGGGKRLVTGQGRPTFEADKKIGS
ncbi:hypothetical protein [Desulfosarcina ovata]|uniref:hypothetical protein n=1 Tax=Desulfosarcina ovata TaxID=83564 RepID=UPI0015664721|nr:hypothetical protein [Desulfosarcina ovata]